MRGYIAVFCGITLVLLLTLLFGPQRPAAPAVQTDVTVRPSALLASGPTMIDSEAADILAVRVDGLFMVDRPGTDWIALVGPGPNPRLHPTTVLTLCHGQPSTTFRFEILRGSETETRRELERLAQSLKAAGLSVTPLRDDRELTVFEFERLPKEGVTEWMAQGAVAFGRVPGQPDTWFFVFGIWDRDADVKGIRTAQLFATARTVRALPPER